MLIINSRIYYLHNVNPIVIQGHHTNIVNKNIHQGLVWINYLILDESLINNSYRRVKQNEDTSLKAHGYLVILL